MDRLDLEHHFQSGLIRLLNLVFLFFALTQGFKEAAMTDRCRGIRDNLSNNFGLETVSDIATLTDLKDYILSEAMTLTTDVTANRPSEDTVIKATYLLDVGVTLQGVRNQACN